MPKLFAMGLMITFIVFILYVTSGGTISYINRTNTTILLDSDNKVVTHNSLESRIQWGY